MQLSGSLELDGLRGALSIELDGLRGALPLELELLLQQVQVKQVQLLLSCLRNELPAPRRPRPRPGGYYRNRARLVMHCC